MDGGTISTDCSQVDRYSRQVCESSRTIFQSWNAGEMVFHHSPPGAERSAAGGGHCGESGGGGRLFFAAPGARRELPRRHPCAYCHTESNSVNFYNSFFL